MRILRRMLFGMYDIPKAHMTILGGYGALGMFGAYVTLLAFGVNGTQAL